MIIYKVFNIYLTILLSARYVKNLFTYIFSHLIFLIHKMTAIYFFICAFILYILYVFGVLFLFFVSLSFSVFFIVVFASFLYYMCLESNMCINNYFLHKSLIQFS